MSGEGPDSVPTSADPRSRRPTKKRALTPVSAQATSVDALFAKPDQHIRIPDPARAAENAAKRLLPPEIVANVQGSSAGAGSGEFHVYKASRRREYERLKEMDAEVKREEDQTQFEEDKMERERKDDEKTRKNREKREKMKARKTKKGKGTGGLATGNDNKSGPNGSLQPPKNGAADGENSESRSSQDARAAKSMPQPAGLVIHDDDD